MIDTAEKQTELTWSWLRKLNELLKEQTELEELTARASESFIDYLGYQKCEFFIFDEYEENNINALASSSFFNREMMSQIFLNTVPYLASENELVVPIEFNNRSIGIIFFQKYTNSIFIDKEIDLLWSFADNVSAKITELQIPAEEGNSKKKQVKDISNTIFNNLRGFLEASLEKLRLLEEQNRRLVELNKLRSELINNVSHELRTPLVSIMGFSNILQRHEVNEDLVKESAEQIQSAGRRLSRMIDDLIQINKVENKGFELSLELVDIGEITKILLEEFKPLNKEHEFFFKHPEKYPLIEADRKLLRRVVENLITNAIKYSPKGGKIEAVLSQEKNFLELTIIDYGIGMSNDEQQKMFERFFRAKNTDTEKIPGLGLGLSIAKEAVEALNGKITCSSNRGSGTRFSVSFPCATVL